MRGRKPEVKALDGALSKVPAAPATMPERAKREWREVLGVLVKQRKIAKHELAIVEAYCRVVAHIAECEAAIADYGMVMVSPSGETKRRPETTLLKEYHATLARLASEMGITPASREKNKGGAPGDGESSEFGVDI